MNPNYLDFEQPIAELEMKIEELKSVVDNSEINISDEIGRLKSKSPGTEGRADYYLWRRFTDSVFLLCG